mmetsp:Transcript_6733/g.12236  ORF Transcript_6733/g.12236 Transcript_6733/m.12236 type:complete len:266 (-) Transcript_6733:233-1030(-)
MSTYECFGVEVTNSSICLSFCQGSWITPVDRNATSCKRMEKLLSAVAWIRGILKAHVEAVAAQESHLVLHRSTDVVHHFATAIDSLVPAGQDLDEPGPEFSFVHGGVAGHPRAKTVTLPDALVHFAAKSGFMCFQHCVNLLVEHPQRNARMHCWGNALHMVEGDAQRHPPNRRPDVFACEEYQFGSRAMLEVPETRLPEQAAQDNVRTFMWCNHLNILQVLPEPVLAEPPVGVVLKARPKIHKGDAPATAKAGAIIRRRPRSATL